MRRFLAATLVMFLFFINLGDSFAAAASKNPLKKEFEWLSPGGEGGVIVKNDFQSAINVNSDRGAIVTSRDNPNAFRIVKFAHSEAGAMAIAVTPKEVHVELSPSLESAQPDIYVNNQPVSAANGVVRVRLALSGKKNWHEVRVEDVRDVSTSTDPDLRQFDSMMLTFEAPTSTALIPTALALGTSNSSYATITSLRYQTFIPEASVIAPSTLCLAVPPARSPYSVWLFDGDNRGFMPYTAKNKTAVIVNVDWQAGQVSGTTRVGKTTLRGIMPFYETVFEDQADSKLMSWSAYGPVTNNSILNLHTEASNPFCPGVRPIYANITGSVNVQGGYSFSGTFRQVPNHEFYVKSSLDSSWRTIFRADNAGFTCLTPVVDWCNISGNWTPSTPAWYR